MLPDESVSIPLQPVPDEAGGLTFPSRPEPSGIDGFLRWYALAAMTLGPVAGIWILYLFRGIEERGILLAPLPIIAVGVMAIFGFTAGYFIYSGNFHGRSLGTLFALLTAYEMELLGAVFSRTESRGRDSAWFTLSLVCAAGIVCYLSWAQRCKNNYGKRYSGIPIQSPLTPFGRKAWLGWGWVSGFAVAAMCAYCLVPPDPWIARGFEPIAKDAPPRVVGFGESRFVIPHPATATLVDAKEQAVDGGRVWLKFAEPGDGQTIFYTVGFIPGTEDVVYDAVFFAAFKRSCKEAFSSGMRVVAEDDATLVVETAGVEKRDGLAVHYNKTETLAAVHRRLIVLSVVATNGTMKPPASLPAMRAWLDAVLAANPNEEEEGEDDPAPPRLSLPAPNLGA